MVEDSLCVGQRRVGKQKDDNERVLLFLKMKATPDGTSKYPFTAKLEADIRNAIRSALSIRHVPAYIFEIDDIPVSSIIVCTCVD